MWKALRPPTLVVAYLCVALSASAQEPAGAPPTPAVPAQFQCQNETGPFASYCDQINLFLTTAASHKDSAGKIDRSDRDVASTLSPFLIVYTTDSFEISLASRVAIQDAIRTLPTPDNPAASGATLSSVNQNRQDRQSGAGSNASGTTSLVEKAGTAAILDFALESGALTRSVSGNTATLSGNVDGMWRALTGRQALCFDCKDSGALGTKLLRNLNLSAAFLIDQQSSSFTNTSGSANATTPSTITDVVVPKKTGKLSSFTVRYQLWNPYDPHSAKFLSAWTKASTGAKDEIDKKAKDFDQALEKLLVKKPIENDDQFKRLREAYREVFYRDAESGNLQQLRQDFLSFYEATVDAWTMDDSEFNQKVAAVNVSLAQYRNLWSQIFDNAKGQPLLTFEYAFNRPASQPETHDFRLVVGYTPQGAVGLLSVNAAISMYGATIPVGAKYGRLHDGQISAEYDRPIAVKDNPNQAAFSLAAYWQYQPDPSVLNITAANLAPGTSIQLPQDAQVLLGTAGSLWVTQAKFTINGKSGIKIPIAVKWANKTDLLSGNKIGAQVGITYDFSSLSGLFGGGSQ